MGRPSIDADAVMGKLARDGGAHSPLYLWMRENYDALAQLIARDRPVWVNYAAVFTDAGLTDRNGERVTAKTARATWYRVRREQARQKSAVAVVPTKPKPVEDVVRFVEPKSASVPSPQASDVLRQMDESRRWLGNRS